MFGLRFYNYSFLAMQRIIMHIDMNSYFASCEQQDTPAWRGRPVGVCEHLGGIIIAPSVEAKRWGVKTGTPVWEAKKLCPRIILTTTNPDRYRYYTAKFLQVFEDYTASIERYSIDEAFLDLTKVCNIRKPGSGLSASGNKSFGVDPYAEAARIALEIKERVKREVGDYLRCSVGVGWSKLVAKIGSDMQKPDGLTVLRPADKPFLYRKLKLVDIPGIGHRQARRLASYGIRTLSDLRGCPRGDLVGWFGVMGHHLHSMGQLEGLWHEAFSEAAPLKSVGHMYTVAQEFRTVPYVGEKVLYRLSEMVARRLRGLGLGGTAVASHVVGDAHLAFGGQVQLGTPTSSGQDIFASARQLILKELCGVWPERVHRVGVTAFGLVPCRAQLSLFPSVDRRKRLDVALDAINYKYRKEEWAIARERAALGSTPGNRGNDVILPCPAFFAQNIIHDSIGFGRMREFTVADYKRGG